MQVLVACKKHLTFREQQQGGSVVGESAKGCQGEEVGNKTQVCAEDGRWRERREELSLVKHGAVYSSRSTVTEAHFRKRRDFRPPTFSQKSLTVLNQVVLVCILVHLQLYKMPTRIIRFF